MNTARISNPSSLHARSLCQIARASPPPRLPGASPLEPDPSPSVLLPRRTFLPNVGRWDLDHAGALLALRADLARSSYPRSRRISVAAGQFTSSARSARSSPCRSPAWNAVVPRRLLLLRQYGEQLDGLAGDA